MNYFSIWLTRVWYFVRLYIIGLYCLWQQLFFWRPNEFADSVKVRRSISNRWAFVTGVNVGGIGGEIVQLLLANDWHVIACCRDTEESNRLISSYRNMPKDRLTLLHCNLCLGEQVVALVDKVKARTSKLNLFINNAGVMMPPYNAVDEDGTEEQWMVNFIAPVILCEGLLDLVSNAARDDSFGRFVLVSSVVLHAGRLSTSWFKYGGSDRQTLAERRTTYCAHLSYANSKLALALYGKYLGQRLSDQKGLSCCTVHPGVIDSHLFRHTSFFTRIFVKLPMVRICLRSPRNGAEDVLSIACSLNTKNAEYYENSVTLELRKVDYCVRKEIEKTAVKLAAPFKSA